jgi:hypothetical protein
MNLDADFATFDIQANGGHFAFAQGNTDQVFHGSPLGFEPRSRISTS